MEQQQKTPGINSRCYFFVMGWVMGLEPTNAGATTRCVNHFATPTIGNCFIGAPGEIRTPDNLLRRQMLYPTELQAQFKDAICQPRLPLQLKKENWELWSGQRDLNPRPPAPKAGALPSCAIPRLVT